MGELYRSKCCTRSSWCCYSTGDITGDDKSSPGNNGMSRQGTAYVIWNSLCLPDKVLPLLTRSWSARFYRPLLGHRHLAPLPSKKEILATEFFFQCQCNEKLMCFIFYSSFFSFFLSISNIIHIPSPLPMEIRNQKPFPAASISVFPHQSTHSFNPLHIHWGIKPSPIDVWHPPLHMWLELWFTLFILFFF